MGSLRTLFALSVVIAHSPWHGGYVFVGGQNAVQLFYMTSGFVISHVLCNVPAYHHTPTFYASRALRLYPVYFAVLAVALAWELGAADRVAEVFRRVPDAARAFLALVNVTLFGQDWVLFAGIRGGELVPMADFRASEVALWQGLAVPQAWTLGIELAFYALAPFIVPRPRLIYALFAGSLAARLAAVAAGFGAADPWTYRFFPFELALFLAGVISHQKLLPVWRRVLSAGAPRWLPAAATFVLLGVCASFFRIPGTETAKTLALFAAYAVLMPLAFVFQQASRVDDAIGDLSYPLYLVHYLLIGMCASLYVAVGVENPWARLAFYVAASLAAATALHFTVVRPVERWRSALRNRSG